MIEGNGQKTKNNFTELLFFGLFVQQLFIYKSNKQKVLLLMDIIGFRQLESFLITNSLLKVCLNLIGSTTEKCLAD